MENLWEMRTAGSKVPLNLSGTPVIMRSSLNIWMIFGSMGKFKFSEIAAVYGGGFGDQHPSVLLRENSSRDTDPRSVGILIGKDSLPLAVTGLGISDWNLQNGTVFDLNQTADGNYSLSLDLNGSYVGNTLSVDANVSLDNDGKPNEAFEEIYLHELVYDESHLVSRWAFDESNGSRIRDLGIAVNDSYLVSNSALVASKFGNALSMDGSGDYMSVPKFSGIHEEGALPFPPGSQPILDMIVMQRTLRYSGRMVIMRIPCWFGIM